MPYKSILPADEVHVLWISEGMSCAGDSVAMTAGTLPPIEGDSRVWL